jgi:hypothetical protein
MKRVCLMMLLLCSAAGKAVHINPEGVGQVLLLPYYTVNNDLNTLVSVTNHSDQGKAVKINVREGHNGYAGLSYNVYLAPRDVWVFALLPDTSSDPITFGEDTATMFTVDASCSSLAGLEPTPLSKDALVDGDQTFERLREGFIEVIEMGEVTGDALADISRSQLNATPDDCAAIDANWQAGGMWHAASGGDPMAELQPPVGDLSAEVFIIDVAQGINFSYPTVALADFFPPGEVPHTPPGEDTPSLDAANTHAWVMHEGLPMKLQFERGIDAVTGLLMKRWYYVNYDINPDINGRSELVFSFPTRRFYYRGDVIGLDPPFFRQPLGQGAGIGLYGANYMGAPSWVDRGGSQRTYSSGGCSGCQNLPPGVFFGGSVGVMVLREDDSQVPPLITGSMNYDIDHEILYYPRFDRSAYEGVLFGGLGNDSDRPFTATRSDTGETVTLYGQPVLGLMFQTYTNGDAQPGLLAQYGGVQPLRSETLIVTESEQ